MKKGTYYAGILAIALAGCSENDSAPEIDEPKEHGITLAEVLSTDESAVITEINASQFAFFKSLNRSFGEANFVCSPLSMQINLSMLSHGCSGATASEIAAALGTDRFASLYSANKLILGNLSKIDSSSKLQSANAFWYSNAYSVDTDFSAALANYYGAPIYSFTPGDADAVQQVNRWCSDHTGGMITNIVNEMPEAALLANALWFQSPWVNKFDESATHTANFYGSKSTTKVPLMYRTSDLVSVYREGDDEPTALTLECGNGKFAVSYVMPPIDTDVNSFIATANFAEIFKASGLYSIDYRVPKFTLTTSRVDLRQPLKDMGVNSLFASGLDKAIIGNTICTDIFQSCSVKFDESGATAAATTWSDMAIAPGPGEMIEINRPFVFFIREVSTGIVLFAGKVENL